MIYIYIYIYIIYIYIYIYILLHTGRARTHAGTQAGKQARRHGGTHKCKYELADLMLKRLALDSLFQEESAARNCKI